MTLPDKEKALVIQIFFTMIMQFVLTMAGLIAFFIVLFKLIESKDAFQAGKLAGLEAMLAGSIYLCYKFFFPSDALKGAVSEIKEAFK